MECKKCSNLNFLISQNKQEEAVASVNEHLTMFHRESIVPFEHTVFRYFCKSCFNLYSSELKSTDFDHSFNVEKFSTQDGELLKHLAYSFTLFNLTKAYKEYHSKFEKVDVYFAIDSSNPLSDIFSNLDNYSMIDVIRLLGVNSPEHFYSPNLQPSFSDLLMNLPTDARVLQDYVLFKFSLSPKDISYEVDFSDFPSTDIVLKTDKIITSREITVIDENDIPIGLASELDFNDYLINRRLSFGNELLILSRDAKKNYQGEPFNYNSDPKPFLDELIYKYLR